MAKDDEDPSDHHLEYDQEEETFDADAEEEAEEGEAYYDEL